MRLFLPALLIVVASGLATDAAADIFRCEGADGGIVFQQTPCPEAVTEAAEAAESSSDDSSENTPEGDSESQAAADSDWPPAFVAAAAETDRSAEAVAACKKRYRDQIDAIDAKMREGFSEEEGEIFKVQLLQLTAKLRAC